MTRRSPLRLATTALLLSAALAGCGPTPEEQRAAEQAAAEARAAALDAKLAPTLQVYRDALARDDAALAVASAEVILADGPGSAAAAVVAEGLEDLRARATAQKETARLAALWGYVSTPIDGESRPQKAASIRNLRPSEDDASSFAVVPTVQLVLRDDPRWGQSVYLVVEDGAFDCGRPCAFSIGFDDAASRRFAGESSSTGTRPALFINDDTGFIRALDAAGTVTIAPVDGKAAPITFEVGGFDIGRYRTGA
jgi:hypothetical protein